MKKWVAILNALCKMVATPREQDKNTLEEYLIEVVICKQNKVLALAGFSYCC